MHFTALLIVYPAFQCHSENVFLLVMFSQQQVKLERSTMFLVELWELKTIMKTSKILKGKYRWEEKSISEVLK